MRREDGFKIVGYYPAWAAEKAEKIRYDVLTHIIYAFAIPKEDGSVFIDNPEFAKRLIEKAHSKNTAISVALGGWSWEDIPLEPTFVKATDTPEGVERLAESITALACEMGFDGVDMDWEHPRVSDGSGKQYEALIVSLEKKLHAKGKLLTAAVIGGVDAEGNPGGIDTGGADVGNAAESQSKAVLDAVDWLNVMAYDGPGDHHASLSYAYNSIHYWKDVRKMPGEKLCLGVPFYGQHLATYEEIMEKVPDAWQYDVIELEGKRCCYNGEPTITEKTRFAKKNLGGIMMWDASQDTKDGNHSLLSAMKKAADE